MPGMRRSTHATLRTSPAFSFSSASRLTDPCSDSPGPGAYFPNRARRPSGDCFPAYHTYCASPVHSMANRLPPNTLASLTPGPGEYNVSWTSVGPRKPAFSLSKSTPAPSQESKQPGPTRYNWAGAKDFVGHHSPPVSMKYRPIPAPNGEWSPSPAEYNPSYPLKVRKGPYAVASIKRRTSNSGAVESVLPSPGPGDYNLLPKPKKPPATCKGKTPQFDTRVSKPSWVGPGPGCYHRATDGIGNWSQQKDCFAADVNPKGRHTKAVPAGRVQKRGKKGLTKDMGSPQFLLRDL